MWDISAACQLAAAPGPDAGLEGPVAGSGQELLTLTGHSDIVTDVAFSPDGRFLATASCDGTARIYVLSIEELVALARQRVTRSLTGEECQKYLHMEECPQGP
jgi:WD40 repeat protein